MAGLETIAQRFQVHGRAGAGGMGVVRRGIDLETEQPVAVKLLHPGQDAERFLREAEVLRTLEHPAIVRYIAHGATEGGRLYIVMQWLEGPTLGELLATRGRLSPDEVLALALRLAAGLAAAHRAGVIHRDIKPSNVVLSSDRLDQATLIDFGVARRAFDPHLTAVGLLVGTASYMSPEQAAGERDPVPGSDVFSLGSLLYRALAGQHPFEAGDPTATLGKILLDEPAALGEARPEAPPELARLITDMLQKRTHARPPDGGSVLVRLEAVAHAVSRQTRASGVSERHVPKSAAVGSDEQRVVWILVVAGVRDSSVAAPLMAATAALGARWDVLADGTGVASFADAGGDRGERAVKLALAMHACVRAQPMALAMGLGVSGRRAPLGNALERACALLARAAPGEVRLDAETARGIDPRHVAGEHDDRLRLGEAAHHPDESRKLLGRATSCVGRERELTTLEAVFDECVADSVARVAVVTGPTGIGKSRVRYELFNRLRDKGGVEFLFGRADSLSAGSPFSLLREALRRATRILEGEPLGDSRSKLLDRTRRLLGATPLAFDTAVFLGELINVPFDDADSDVLRLARSDPAAMGDAIRSAWLDYIGACCVERPVLIVLEDLQWGDRPTASLIDAALAVHHDRPLMVLALGRPELHDLLPNLWAAREPIELRLRPLHRRACEALLAEVLGPEVETRLKRRVVSLADGNAFFLEELIRAVSEGDTELPATVMAIVQARLERLDAEARRVLRAGSVFGERFWRGGLAELCGVSAKDAALERLLGELTRIELLTQRSDAAFPGEVEYVFRHSLVRETVYAALTESDRVRAHGLAGSWLERAGEVDALALAEHFRRAKLAEKAAGFFALAAEQALEGHDLDAALERAKQALRCEPDATTRGRATHVLAHAHLWKGEYTAAERSSLEAIELLEPGSAGWFSAIAEACSSAGALDHESVLANVANLAIGAVANTDEARAAQVMCLSRAATGHLRHGRKQPALAAIARMSEVQAAATTLTDAIVAWSQHGRASLAYFSGESAEFRSALEAAIDAFDRAGDLRAATNDRVNLGFALASLGDYERAEELVRTAAGQAERLGLAKVSAYAWHNLGWIRMQLGCLNEAVQLQKRAIEAANLQHEAFLEGSARAYLSLALSSGGESAEAEVEALRAATLLEKAPALRPYALAALARALLLQGRIDDAVDAADNALAGAESAELPEDSDVLVRLVAAETFNAAGFGARARQTARISCERILERAERVVDSALKKTFLENVPEHARTLALDQSLNDSTPRSDVP